MRVGKSGVVRCDLCGEVIVGSADSLTRSGQTKHFCQGTCLDAYLREHCNDVIVGEVQKQVREEFNFIHKQVCPACKYRLRKLQ